MLFGFLIAHLNIRSTRKLTISHLGKPQYKKERKSSDNVTRGGGEVPPVTSFWGYGGSDDFLSLAFGGKFSHKLDHFWPN